MSCVLVLFWTAMVGVTHQSKAAVPHRLVRVYVHTDDTGDVVEVSARRDSVKELRAALADKKKDLVLVEGRDGADVVVEVVDRTVTIPRVVFGTSPRSGQPPDARTAGLARAVHLRVTLTYRDEPTIFDNKNTLIESNGGWQSAADDVAKQVDKWIVDHRAQILAGRTTLDGTMRH